MTLFNTEESQYKLNQSLLRGLGLLVELNRSSDASGSISSLARQTGLHRTTVKRLLETLKVAGYVEHDVATNLYRLTFRVQQLSYGYRDTIQLTEIAWPFMRELSRKIVWPCSLAAPEGGQMVVRISTRPYSRLSFHPGMPGRALPILSTAAGRAYLAFSSQITQNTLLEIVSNSAHPSSVLVHNQTKVQELMAQIRRQGYAQNIGEWVDEPKFGAFAVPICNSSGEAVVVLNVIFLTRAVNTPAKQAFILENLKQTAHQIEQALEDI